METMHTREFAHLSRFEKTLFSGAEWPVQLPHWLLVQLNQGIAYLQGRTSRDELVKSGVAIIPPNSQVTFLASVLGEAQLRGCAVKLSSLTGLLTASERKGLETEAAQGCMPFRQVGGSEPLAQEMARCFLDDQPLGLWRRLGLMQAFAHWVSPWLDRATQRPLAPELTPKGRLKQFLDQVPESELAELDLTEVAKHLCCCERHASRMFHEVCGCSFRKYVSELRLKRACQMLVQADYKIIDVALESGHSSLALFNYNFKSRFHMTPTEWRERHLPREPRELPRRDLAFEIKDCWLAAKV